MRTGLTISGVGHAAVLLWCVVAFVVHPFHSEPLKGMPVDLISATEFSQMTSGAKNARQADSKPVAEKVAEASPVDDPTAKLAKRELKAAADVPPVPPKPPEPKVKKPPQPPAPVDPIAEALKKDENKKLEPRKPDTLTPTPPKKPVQREPSPQFDPRQVAALLDKRDSQRVASAAGNEINNTASFGGRGNQGGTPSGFSGNPDGLTDVEKAALRAKLHSLWSAPPGMSERKGMVLDVQFELNPDGTLAGPPTVLTPGDGPLFMAASDSVKRAVIRGQPYTMLRPEHYEAWRVLQATFDPTDSAMSNN
jgi:outer membrane biosynthesis protein TonB